VRESAREKSNERVCDCVAVRRFHVSLFPTLLSHNFFCLTIDVTNSTPHEHIMTLSSVQRYTHDMFVRSS